MAMTGHIKVRYKRMVLYSTLARPALAAAAAGEAPKESALRRPKSDSRTDQAQEREVSA